MPELSELQHQCKFVKWARQSSPMVNRLLYSANNGGYRRTREAAILKHAGSNPGVPDLHLPFPAGGYYGLFIELKKDKKSHRRPEQIIYLEELTALGYKAVFADGWEDARDILIEYLGENNEGK